MIAANRVGNFTGAPVIISPDWIPCRRCGRNRYRPRSVTIWCTDCHQIVRYEESAKAAGVDLAALADDEYFDAERGEVVKEGEDGHAIAA